MTAAFDPSAASAAHLHEEGATWQLTVTDAHGRVLLSLPVRTRNTPTTDLLDAELRDLGLVATGTGWSGWLQTYDGTQSRGTTVGSRKPAASPPSNALALAEARRARAQEKSHARSVAAALCLSAFGFTVLVLAAVGASAGYYNSLRLTTLLICTGLVAAILVARTPGWLLVIAPIAVIWNPVAPVYLARETWIWVDVLGAVAFLSITGWALRTLWAMHQSP